MNDENDIRIVFISRAAGGPPAEAAEAVRALRGAGLEAEIARGEDRDRAEDPHTLWVCDDAAAAADLKGRGAAVAGWSHAGNRGEHFSGIRYVLEEPAFVDGDSYVKIWQRERHLPWTILETDRCLVREFVPADMEAICALYDEEACRWMEAPSAHLEREREILRAYIDRVYSLYGYGHWAVILRETGELIGRMGYAVPRAGSGITEEDGILGYLLGAPWRRRGLTEEVCGALIRFGFEQLGFARIAAEIHRDNAASRQFIEKMGFRRLEGTENARGECTYILE